MKATILAASLLALSASAFAADVGVSISVGQPGFYGQVVLGDFAPSPLLYGPQPVIIAPRRGYAAAPIYLRVPPGHAKHWSKHCRAYHACNQRVYFVQDGWYNNEYVPRYREHHGHGGPGRPEFRDDRRDHRGPGPGHDRGRDRGHDRGDDHGRGHDRHDR